MHIFEPVRIGDGNDCTVMLDGSYGCGLTDAKSHLYTYKTSDSVASSISSATSSTTSSTLSFTDPHLYSLNMNLTFNSPVTFGSVPGSTLYNSCNLNVEHTNHTLSSSNSIVASGQNPEKNQKTKY